MTAVFALIALALLVFELALVARMVIDWVGVLAPVGASRLGRARACTYAVTEPVLAPVRSVVTPLRLGTTSIDLAFPAVFFAVVVLRSVFARA